MDSAQAVFGSRRRRANAHSNCGAQDQLLEQQADDGHWCAELEGDTILESEYLI